MASVSPLLVNSAAPASGTAPTSSSRAARRARHRRRTSSARATIVAGARARQPTRTRSASPAATARSALVAAVAIERGLPFVCIPFGTRNHFARDVGPRPRRSGRRARRRFVDGEERRIDVGRANDRALPEQRLARCLRAARAPARAPSPPQQRVRAPAGARDRRVASASPSTSPSTASRSRRGSCSSRTTPTRSRCCRSASAQRLDEGHLHLYAPHGLLRTGWEEREGERFTIDARLGRLRAAVDGEPETARHPDRASGSSRGRYACSCRAAHSRSTSSCPGKAISAGRSSCGNQRSSSTSSAATGSPAPRTIHVTEKTWRPVVGLDVDAQAARPARPRGRSPRGTRAAGPSSGCLGLVQEAAWQVPVAAPRLVLPPCEEHSTVALEDALDARDRVRVVVLQASFADAPLVGRGEVAAAARAEAPAFEETHASNSRRRMATTLYRPTTEDD